MTSAFSDLLWPPGMTHSLISIVLMSTDAHEQSCSQTHLSFLVLHLVDVKTSMHAFRSLLFNFWNIVNVSVKEMCHRVLYGFMFEGRGGSKHSDVGEGGTKLSHSLTLRVKIHNLLANFLTT